MAGKVIEVDFEIGDRIYLKTDPEQHPRIVYGYEITQGAIIYKVCAGTATSNHFSFEMSTEKDVINSF